MKIRYRRDLHQAMRFGGWAAEIGVAEGNFSEEILKWPVEISALYMVDSWETRPGQRGDGSSPQSWHDANLARVKERMVPYGNRAVVMKGDSVSVSRLLRDLSLAFVYIDADHSYEGVLRDLQAWVPKLRFGGLVGLHDFLNCDYGVGEAAKKYCFEHGYTLHTISEDHVEDAGAWFYKLEERKRRC